MTKTKQALCDEIVRSWHLGHNIIQLIRSVALQISHPTDYDSLMELQWRLFGHQFVGWNWHVRTWVAANAPHVSTALFDSKPDECCIRLAQATVWRRAAGAKYVSAKGKKTTHVDARVLLRELSQKHDWNTCK